MQRASTGVLALVFFWVAGCGSGTKGAGPDGGGPDTVDWADQPRSDHHGDLATDRADSQATADGETTADGDSPGVDEGRAADRSPNETSDGTADGDAGPRPADTGDAADRFLWDTQVDAVDVFIPDSVVLPDNTDGLEWSPSDIPLDARADQPSPDLAADMEWVAATDLVEDVPPPICCDFAGNCPAGWWCVGATDDLRGVCQPPPLPNTCWNDIDCSGDMFCWSQTDGRPAINRCEQQTGAGFCLLEWCCQGPKGCSEGLQCYPSSDPLLPGTCMLPPSQAGQCWQDRDCPDGQVCLGGGVCPCGALCEQAEPGFCVTP